MAGQSRQGKQEATSPFSGFSPISNFKSQITYYRDGMASQPQKILIAGLSAYVCGLPASNDAPVVFVLHGLGGSAQNVLRRCEDLANHGMVAIAFDHRNHGERLVDRERNRRESLTYALDAYGVCLGSARDVSSMIDHLPAAIGLNTDRIGMTGISLGGHATLIAMSQDNRIRVGAPIIGCGYRTMQLMDRANAAGKELDPEMLELLNRFDPVYHVSEFTNRPLLLVNGGKDTTVPAEPNAIFAKRLAPFYAADPEWLKLSIHPEAGHEVTPGMWREVREWFTAHL